MSDDNIWYLPGPFHRYEGDVKAQAKKAGLVIIDANVTDSRDGAVEKAPTAKLKPEWAGKPEKDEPETDPNKMKVDELRAWLTGKGIEYDAGALKPELQALIPAE
ncbi:MAG TPA: HeH/LEM domain-containing protein [Pseudomonas sp.]